MNAQAYKDKLPSFVAARCEITNLAAQQASAEPVARARFASLRGRQAVDLTAGLGVDCLALAERFEKVTAVEADPVRAQQLIANLNRMGLNNVVVVHEAAEQFLRRISFDFIDFVYLDPDRRATGSKRSDWKVAQPRVDQVLNLVPPHIPVWVKQSPAFDWFEGWRQFPHMTGIEATSWKGETKEIIWKFDAQLAKPDSIELLAKNISGGLAHEFRCSISGSNSSVPQQLIAPSDFQAHLCYYLIDPVPALRSLHIETRWIESLGVDACQTSPHGWFLTTDRCASPLGRIQPLAAWRIDRLSELGNWIKRNGWIPQPLSIRGIRLTGSQALAKWNIKKGEPRPMWLGTSGAGTYFLAVGQASLASSA